MLSLDVKPGVVTAVFFVVFDLFVLAFVDIVTTNIVCALYYLDITSGIPVRVKSVDVLGLTTYLVGKRFTVANVVGLLIKLAFVIMVFFVNLNIESQPLPRDSPQIRNGTFDFKPSEALLDLGLGEDSRYMAVEDNCRVIGENNATFYRLIFNARRKERDEEEGSSVPTTVETIRRESFVCLRPDFVADPIPILTVSGCSTLGNTGCADETPYIRVVLLDESKAENTEFSWQVLGTALFGYPRFRYDAKQVRAALPEYEDPQLACIDLGYSAARCCPYEDGETGDSSACWCKPRNRSFQQCVLYSFNSTHTLLERWRLDPLGDGKVRLTRPFPGPLFVGEVVLQRTQIDGFLIFLDAIRSWLDFATRVYRESLVYEAREVKFREIRLRTRIPLVAIILGVFMLAIVAVATVVVAMTIGRDERPRFNTIDGLSSIAREEMAPSYNSLRKGAPVFLALTMRSNNLLHFGPVGDIEDSVRRDGRSISSEVTLQMYNDPEAL